MRAPDAKLYAAARAPVSTHRVGNHGYLWSTRADGVDATKRTIRSSAPATKSTFEFDRYSLASYVMNARPKA